MRRKKLPNNKHKGLLIYCNVCRNHFTWTEKTVDSKNIEPSCGSTKTKLSSCKNHDKHRYRVRAHIPGTSKRFKSKTLSAVKYPDAVIQAIAFQNDFTKELTGQNELDHEKTYLNYLFGAQIEYLDFLNNINVPEHQKKKRTPKYVKEQKKCLLLFNEALTKNKIDKRIITLQRIDDAHVGYYHSYLLKDMSYKNSTYNKKMSSLRTFFDWALKKYQIKRDNPFDEANRRTVVIQKDTIYKEEFEGLLNIITPKNGIVVIKGKNRIYNRDFYRPYLKDALKLALHTGGRREEVVDLRWDMIKSINNEPAFLAVNNLKVERMTGEGFNENIAPKIIPITKGLLDILNQLGYQEKKDSTDFMICPDRTDMSNGTLMDLLSKGFSHYYKQLDTGRNLHFKCLRKTYLTYLDMAVKGDTKVLSSHSTDDVLKKHYIDEKIVSTAIKNLSIFEA